MGDSWNSSQGKEKAQGALISVHKYLMGGNEEEKARLLSADPTGKTRSKRHKLKNSTFSVRQEYNFCHERSQTVEQVAQRGYGVFLWGHSKPVCTWSWATCLSGPA